jgi:GNAT superfamily N-acetyltransferase
MQTMNETPSYAIRIIDEDTVISSFDCGDLDLNDFITSEAWMYQTARLAVTYLYESNDGRVDAYFSLDHDRISLSDFENKTDFNRFRKKRFPNAKRLKSYPAIEICRLGVSKHLKNMHIGTNLIDLIKRMYYSDNKAGCRFITVDAYRDAIPFYEKNGFIPLNEDDAEDATRVLYFDLMDLE